MLARFVNALDNTRLDIRRADHRLLLEILNQCSAIRCQKLQLILDRFFIRHDHSRSLSTAATCTRVHESPRKSDSKYGEDYYVS
jgi:hypothetical protein